MSPLRRIRLPLLLLLAAGAILLLFSRSSLWTWIPGVKAESAPAPRDPTTGVISGTEARQMGDPEATAACLLLHGFAGSPKDFGTLGERLAEAGFFVHLARLPGHGTTPADLEAQTVETLLAGARADREALERRFSRVALVGFSMGGALATLLAAEDPPDRLVLVAPYYEVTMHWYYLLPPPTWNRLLQPLIRTVPKRPGLVMVNRREAVDDLFSYRAIPTRSVAVLADLGERAQQPEVLARITSPTLHLHSPSDGAASYRASREAFEQLGARDRQHVRVDERSNHHLLSDWDRKEVQRRIVEHLEPLLAPDPSPDPNSDPG